MSTFVDANVLLELLLPDRPKPELAEKALSADIVKLSPLTAHLCVHFGKKARVPVGVMLSALNNYSFTDMGQTEVNWAISNRQDEDFEDSLQVACAVLHGCDQFVTFDQDLAKNYRHLINIQLLK